MEVGCYTTNKYLRLNHFDRPLFLIPHVCVCDLIRYILVSKFLMGSLTHYRTNHLTVVLYFLAGKMIMADFVKNRTQVGVQFEGFQSKLDILMYYVALSNHSEANGTDCQLYVCIIYVFFSYFDITQIKLGVHKSEVFAFTLISKR